MVDARAKRWWQVGIGLAVSAAALAGLVLVEGRAAQADVLAAVRAVGPERTTDAEPHTDPLDALAEPDWSGVQGKIRKQSGASATKAQTAVPPEPVDSVTTARRDPTPATDTPAPGSVLVPDFTGKSLAAARRQARKLGIKLVMRDVYDSLVPREDAQLYKVRSQSVAAGQALQQGETLTLKSRMYARYAMGY